MAITDWPPEERPRERLLAEGADSLRDDELLAGRHGVDHQDTQNRRTIEDHVVVSIAQALQRLFENQSHAFEAAGLTV